jgi:PBP1b-binding outer membrane lipoprotein LpoB
MMKLKNVVFTAATAMVFFSCQNNNTPTESEPAQGANTFLCLQKFIFIALKEGNIERTRGQNLNQHREPIPCCLPIPLKS